MDVVLRELARHDSAANRALEAIDEFDRLQGAPEDLVVAVRLIARFSGFPARIADQRSGILLRSDPDGVVSQPEGPPNSGWLSAPVFDGEDPVLWIEHTGDMSITEAALLDRAAAMMRHARLDDASSHPTFESKLIDLLFGDVALPETLLAPFGLRSDTLCRAICTAGPTVQIAVSRIGRPPTHTPHDRWIAKAAGRTGIGVAVRAENLAESWRTAVTALAFAAEGTEHDPGLSVVRFEDLGILGDLAPDILTRGAAHDDVLSLDRAAASMPWGLATLDALARHSSLRLAAEALHAHHSTIQSRVAVLQRRLRWDIQTTTGKQRLHLALAARSLLLHPPHPSHPVPGRPLVLDHLGSPSAQSVTVR